MANIYIPRNPDDLTPECLTHILRDAGVIEHGRVTGVSAGGSTDSEGLTGLTTRIRLEYDTRAPRAPVSLIAKCSSAIREMRERPNTQAAYQREVRFYKEIADTVPLRTPRCYHADIDTESGDHIILLEDLYPARGGNRTRGCSREQAELAIHRIAGFHAAWWESGKLDTVDWLGGVARQPTDCELRVKHAEWWPVFLRKTKGVLPESSREVGSVLGEYRGRILSHANGHPRSLVHSDYNLDNMLFGDADSGIPFAVVDWQFVRRGHPIFDVGLFLCQNLEQDLRRKIEHDLLSIYVDTLGEHGVSYPVSELETDYCYCILQRYGALISTIAAMPFTPEQIQMHIDVLLPRCLSALDDNNAERVIQE